MNNIVRGARNRLPAVFDILIAGILGVTFIPNQFLQGIFFVFYSLFLFIVTLLMTPRRTYSSIPLALLTLWGFAMIFTHNQIAVVENSIVNKYFNVSIMFEGFIYLLCGVLLLRTIIAYSKRPLFILALLPISIIPLVKHGARVGSMSIIAAFIVSVVIYLIINKERLVAFIIASFSFATACIIWPWVTMKFTCRPYVWAELARQTMEHPVIGQGFNHTLKPDNMIWVRKIGTVVYGWIYAHNDYLNLSRCLGIIALILVVWFIIESIRRIGNTIYLIPFLTIVIASCFQLTMFQVDKAVLCLVVGAICLKETQKGE